MMILITILKKACLMLLSFLFFFSSFWIIFHEYWHSSKAFGTTDPGADWILLWSHPILFMVFTIVWFYACYLSMKIIIKDIH